MSREKDGKKDYVLDLPEMTVEKISKLCWILQRGINQDAQAQLEEIVRRCNQFVPQVMRYKRLLDQFDREVIRPEIAAKKAGTETLFDILTQIRARAAVCPEAYKELAGFLRQVADRIDSAWKREKIRIEEARAECDCCVGRGKNCPLERTIKLFNDEPGAIVERGAK